MREIKFRAWDRYDNKWEDEIGEDYYCEDNAYMNKLLIINDSFKTKERFTYMQYTGLKDINNKELYEGDIVKILPNNYIALAEYSQESCAYLLKNKNGYRGYFSIIQEGFEVIGNIYENPELLENHT